MAARQVFLVDLELCRRLEGSEVENQRLYDREMEQVDSLQVPRAWAWQFLVCLYSHCIFGPSPPSHSRFAPIPCDILLQADGHIDYIESLIGRRIPQTGILTSYIFLYCIHCSSARCV